MAQSDTLIHSHNNIQQVLNITVVHLDVQSSGKPTPDHVNDLLMNQLKVYTSFNSLWHFNLLSLLPGYNILLNVYNTISHGVCWGWLCHCNKMYSY